MYNITKLNKYNDNYSPLIFVAIPAPPHPHPKKILLASKMMTVKRTNIKMKDKKDECFSDYFSEVL